MLGSQEEDLRICMIKVKVDRNRAPDGWDQMWRGSGLGGIYQTNRWAQLAISLRRAQATYIRVEKNGTQVAQCLLIKEGIFSDRLRRSALSPVLLPVFGKCLQTVYCLNGPIFFETPTSDVVEALVETAEEIATDAIELSFNPQRPLAYQVSDFQWQEMGYAQRRHATYVVDLQQDFEKNCHRSVRKNVRKCRELGVTIKEVERDQYLEFYQLIDQFRKASGLNSFPFNHFVAHIEALGCHKSSFVAELDGKMIAGLGVLAFNDLLIEVEAATSPVCREQRVHAHDLLKMDIMHRGRQKGSRFFDLAGVAIQPKNEPEEGIKRFKSKFGGQYLEYSSYVKVMSKRTVKALKWGRNVLATEVNE